MTVYGNEFELMSITSQQLLGLQRRPNAGGTDHIISLGERELGMVTSPEGVILPIDKL